MVLRSVCMAYQRQEKSGLVGLSEGTTSGFCIASLRHGTEEGEGEGIRIQDTGTLLPVK